MKFFAYGPGKKMVAFMLWLSWPVIYAGKRLSGAPVLRWIINPFFIRPHNEVTSIPISKNIAFPESVVLPRSILERLVSEIEDRFILDECICRAHNRVAGPERGVGCMALGPAIRRMHPSHGRTATADEAVAHIRRAADRGLIANVAHVWIDPAAFWLNFKQLMFICFCDDANCIYRTHMRSRGPNLDGAYRRLPGISVTVTAGDCDGCGLCADRCFVAAIRVDGGAAAIGGDCKGCGRCAEICPRGAIVVKVDGEEELMAQIKERIRAVARIPGIDYSG